MLAVIARLHVRTGGQGLGPARARRTEQLTPLGGVACFRVRGRYRQADVRLGWNAHVAADDVSHVGCECSRSAGLVVGRYLEWYGEQDPTLVPVIHEGTGRKAERHRPPDLSGAKASG